MSRVPSTRFRCPTWPVRRPCRRSRSGTPSVADRMGPTGPTRDRPIDQRNTAPIMQPGEVRDAEQDIWMRADGRLPDDPLLHACVVAYASDMSLLDTVIAPAPPFVGQRVDDGCQPRPCDVVPSAVPGGRMVPLPPGQPDRSRRTWLRGARSSRSMATLPSRSPRKASSVRCVHLPGDLPPRGPRIRAERTPTSGRYSCGNRARQPEPAFLHHRLTFPRQRGGSDPPWRLRHVSHPPRRQANPPRRSGRRAISTTGR